MNKYMIGAIFALTASIAFAATDKKAPAKESNLICEKNEKVVELMDKNNFISLLNMTNENDVVETVWLSGTSIIITANAGDKSCILATMKDVIYNPDTLQALVKNYLEQQKKQKDI
jgi:hypothetical protein